MDFTLILLAGLLVVMIFFTWRNSKKRKVEAEEMQTKMLPGAEIMTQHGIFGTLVSIDDDTNEAVIESTPGTQLRVHRQTIARVIDPEENSDELESADDVADESSDADVDDSTEQPKRASREKPTETE